MAEAEVVERVEQMWAAYWRDPSGRALEALVTHYEPLARYLAHRALAKAPAWQDADDIVSFAHHGLLDAIAKFRPDRGAKFETYATRRIAGAIIDWQRRMDPLTRSDRKAVKDYEKAFAALEAEQEREPTMAEVAVELGTTEAEVRQLCLTRQSLQGSLDELIEQPAAENGLIAGASRLTSDDTAEEVGLDLLEARHHLAAALRRLSPLQRAFVLLHYGEDLSQRDTAHRLGLHEVKSGQIRVAVLHSISGP